MKKNYNVSLKNKFYVIKFSNISFTLSKFYLLDGSIKWISNRRKIMVKNDQKNTKND